MKKIRMRDIAQSLEISTVTVSKALSGKEGVSTELRDRIKSAASEMGYLFHAPVNSGNTGKSCNVGVIIADRFIKDDVDAFYLKMYHNVVNELSKTNYYGIMEIISCKAEKELSIPNIISDHKVDGVIVLGQMNVQYLRIIKKTAIPLVFLDFSEEELDVDSVISDSFYGGYTLTNHMIVMEHKEIGFVGNLFATSSILDRYLGYYKALITNKIAVNKEWIIIDRSEDGEYVDFMLPNKMPTAFVCNCDQVAYLFVKKLKKGGYKVPEDISVVGFDNDIYATLSSPKLTTIEVDVERMAETAVTAVLRKIQGDNRSLGRKVVSGNLIIRESARKLTDLSNQKRE